MVQDGERQDEEILGSNFLLKTKPDVIDAGKSIPGGDGLSIGTAGVASSFFINSRDKYSNYKTGGSGGSWTATLSLSSRAAFDVASMPVKDINASGVDRGDGTFTMTYSITRAGVYSMLVKSSTSQDISLQGTPTVVQIYPG